MTALLMRGPASMRFSVAGMVFELAAQVSGGSGGSRPGGRISIERGSRLLNGGVGAGPMSSRQQPGHARSMAGIVLNLVSVMPGRCYVTKFGM